MTSPGTYVRVTGNTTTMADYDEDMTVIAVEQHGDGNILVLKTAAGVVFRLQNGNLRKVPWEIEAMGVTVEAQI